MTASGFIQTRNLRDGSIYPSAQSIRNRRYVLDMFDGRVALFTGVGTGFPTAVAAQTNILKTTAGHYEYYQTTAQTILPAWDATNGYGLDIGGDQVAAEGSEICFGAIISTTGASRGRLNFTVCGEGAGSNAAEASGTAAPAKATAGSYPSLPFFARLKVRVADASGLNPLQFGFRKVEAFQATGPTAYTDYAAFENTVNGTIADIKMITRLNTGTATSTDSTLDWADATTREFKVIVGPTGAVSFFVDNLAPTVNYTGFVFDPTDVVVPFVRLIQGAASPGACFLQEFEAGFIKPNAV